MHFIYHSDVEHTINFISQNNTLQVSQPLSSTSEQQTAKENKSIVPKVLQKKISKLRSETEI